MAVAHIPFQRNVFLSDLTKIIANPEKYGVSAEEYVVSFFARNKQIIDQLRIFPSASAVSGAKWLASVHGRSWVLCYKEVEIRDDNEPVIVDPSYIVKRFVDWRCPCARDFNAGGGCTVSLANRTMTWDHTDETLAALAALASHIQEVGQC